MRNGISMKFSERCRNMDIKDLPIFDEYYIPFTGESAVNVGDYVPEGTPLTKDEGDNIIVHASVAGKIKDITKDSDRQYIIIESDKKIPPRTYQIYDPFQKRREVLIDHIRKFGITSSTEEGIPPHIKLKNMINKVDTVIINGVESEPFLSANYRLLSEHPNAIIKGAEIIAYITGAKNITIVINKDFHLKLILEEKFKNNPKINIIEIPKIYPNGYEKFIIKTVTGIELHDLESSDAADCIVYNANTCFAIHEALTFGKPMIEKIITVDGAFCAEHGNYRVKIGTPISKFMRPFAAMNSYVMINGGPLVGKGLQQERGTTKNIRGILIFGELTDEPIQDCISCGYCVESCPIRLEPHKLIDMIQNNETEHAVSLGLTSCINCHLCTHICPSSIPVGQIITQAKKEYLAKNIF